MDKIKKILEQSLLEFYQNDCFLINHECGEETINHRLAIYLEKHFSNKAYHIDLEYNQGTQKPKHQSFKFKKGSSIIIHKRGSSNHNYLLISTKKNYLNANDLEDFENVLNVLKKPLNYTYGCLIELLPQEDFFTLVLVKKHNIKHESEMFFIKKPVIVSSI